MSAGGALFLAFLVVVFIACCLIGWEENHR